MPSTTSQNVIFALKSLFSRYSIPEEVISDNGLHAVCFERNEKFLLILKDSIISHLSHIIPRQWPG